MGGGGQLGTGTVTVTGGPWVLEECGVSTVEGSMAIRVAREGNTARTAVE